MNNQPQMPGKSGLPPSFDIRKTSKVSCEKCGGIAFDDTLVLRLVSPILSENGKPGYYPIQAFRCSKCSHVNSEFIPEIIKGDYTENSTILLGEVKLK